MPIDHLLKRPVQTLPPEATCAKAATRMREHNVGSVVVVEEGSPVGIVTERDIVAHVVGRDLDPGATPLRDVMSGEPVVVSAEQGLDQVFAAMRALAIRHVPVVDENGQLRGVVSSNDLLLLLAEQLGDVAQAIRLEMRERTRG